MTIRRDYGGVGGRIISSNSHISATIASLEEEVAQGAEQQKGIFAIARADALEVVIKGP